MGTHGSRRGLTVSAGDTDGVLVILHDGAPAFGPLKHGDPAANRLHYFRIVVMYRSGTDNEFRIGFDVFFMMSLIDPNSKSLQVLHLFTFGNIRTSDDKTHTEQDLCKRGHGNTTDSYQMALPAGR